MSNTAEDNSGRLTADATDGEPTAAGPQTDSQLISLLIKKIEKTEKLIAESETLSEHLESKAEYFLLQTMDEHNAALELRCCVGRECSHNIDTLIRATDREISDRQEEIVEIRQDNARYQLIHGRAKQLIDQARQIIMSLQQEIEHQKKVNI